jgi:bacillithiol biosynthesis cysteine-adding enzyme BshC
MLSNWELYLQQLDAPEPVRQQLTRLRQGAVAVVSGQQAGVCTGPLFTVLKAAATIRLARDLQQSTGKPVVPIFWVASDDHDLGEIHHTFVLNPQGEAQRIRLELANMRQAACTVPLMENATTFWENLLQVGQLSDSRWLEAFQPRPGSDTLGRWFSRCLLAVLGNQGLLPVEPGILGSAARPLFAKVLEEPSEYQSAFTAARKELQAAAQPTPLEADGDPPVFLLESHDRRRLRGASAPFQVGERAYSVDELLGLVRAEEPRLSANVALRPLLQAGCLPAVAYVAGPAEAQYYRQLLPLHDWIGVPRPAVVPRPHATLLTYRSLRTLRKLDRDPMDLFAPVDSTAPAPRWAAEGKDLQGRLASFTSRLLASEPGMKGLQRKARQLEDGLEGLLQRAEQLLNQDHQRLAQHQQGLRQLLYPRNRPQERVLNLLPFLTEQGDALIDALLQIDPTVAGHWLVVPEDS